MDVTWFPNGEVQIYQGFLGVLNFTLLNFNLEIFGF